MTNSKHQQKIRVLVVDDSAFVRRAIIRMFDGDPVIRIVDVAADGESAIALVKSLHPDVVTLDIKMPVLDGLAALERIMKECPTPVIMLSALTEKGGENTIKALELGAIDFIDKSAAGGPMEIDSLARELSAKILVAAKVDIHKLQPVDGEREVGSVTLPLPAAKETELVLIGTSTGGPPALQSILSRIPAMFPCPIIIVQHMPVGFTASLARRLDRLSALSVKEGEDGERLLPGTAYLAPAGKHMKIRRSGSDLRIWLDLSPLDTLHRPSVDTLFESAAAVCGRKALALVLTGMGKDGSMGAQAVKTAGGRVVAESEETCIVFGMPKAVAESVKVDRMVPLYKMVDTILEMI